MVAVDPGVAPRTSESASNNTAEASVLIACAVPAAMWPFLSGRLQFETHLNEDRRPRTSMCGRAAAESTFRAQPERLGPGVPIVGFGRAAVQAGLPAAWPCPVS
jgi:hypothetical protein